MRARTLNAILMTCVVAIVASGCASNEKSGGQKAVDGFKRTQVNLANAQRQVDETLMRMDQLQYTNNLNSTTFRNYKSAVTQLEKQGDDAKWRAENMNNNMDDYVSRWQEEMDKIEDPSVKASVAARREAVRANFEQIRSTAREVKAAYDPFMKDHQDIVQALSINLSPAALPGLKPAMDRAHADGQTLKAKLSALQKQLDNISRGLTPSGSPVSGG